MLGKVKMFDSQKGFGFIRAEDGKEYFFHVSKLKSSELPYINCSVEFELAISEKGPAATNIYLKGNAETAKFIRFGDNRIKGSNIKDYGLSTKRAYYQKVYNVVDTTTSTVKSIDFFVKLAGGDLNLSSSDYTYGGDNLEITESEAKEIQNGRRRILIFPSRRKNEKADYHIDGKKVIFSNAKAATKDDLVVKDIRYLFVTTFQGDNYQYYEDLAGFDIHQKSLELDNSLS